MGSGCHEAPLCSIEMTRISYHNRTEEDVSISVVMLITPECDRGLSVGITWNVSGHVYGVGR
jgi:hypothetical protein